jgi:voltage-gated potassium channel
MDSRPLLALAALAAATEPDLGKESLERFKDRIRTRFEGDPMGTTVSTVLVGAYLFYKAEKGHNPKVTSYYDALIYVSTNLSVGYSDIFARTPAGKALGSVLMTYGPAMAARMLDEPKQGGVADPASRDVVDRLDKILAALEALRPEEGANGALAAEGASHADGAG